MLEYWVWLSAIEKMRPRVKNLLIRHYGDPRTVYMAEYGAYEKLGGISKSECTELENKDLKRSREIINDCSTKGIKIVTMEDDLYPQRLKNIYDPPMVLYVRGNLPKIDDEVAISVVGTRKASAYGLKMASRMGYEITKHGGLVISGMTQGVDAAAARGALLAGGSCIGVLATAIDGNYGGNLALDIEVVGAIVSEYPPKASSHVKNFRARNRISAGLSLGAVVVEAPMKSGALLFASEATEQGKDIFVVPSNADSDSGAGSNALMTDGAKPVMHGAQVLEDYEALYPNKIRVSNEERVTLPTAQEKVQEMLAKTDNEDRPRRKKRETGEGFYKVREKNINKSVDKDEKTDYIAKEPVENVLKGLTEAQLIIVTAIKEDSTHIDVIIERSGFSASKVLGELTMLQLKKIVIQEQGKRFTLNINKK